MSIRTTNMPMMNGTRIVFNQVCTADSQESVIMFVVPHCDKQLSGLHLLGWEVSG